MCFVGPVIKSRVVTFGDSIGRDEVAILDALVPNVPQSASNRPIATGREV